MRVRRLSSALAAGLLGAGLVAGVTACAKPAPQMHPPAKTPVAQGHGGAVVSDTAESTQAGLDVLRSGGSAADAAVAVASTLGVTDPYVAGIGGGGFALVYLARDRKVRVLDFRETAPARASRASRAAPHTTHRRPRDARATPCGRESDACVRFRGGKRVRRDAERLRVNSEFFGRTARAARYRKSSLRVFRR